MSPASAMLPAYIINTMHSIHAAEYEAFWCWCAANFQALFTQVLPGHAGQCMLRVSYLLLTVTFLNGDGLVSGICLLGLRCTAKQA